MNSKAYKSYKIDKYEYLELKYLCLRYWEEKKIASQANEASSGYAISCVNDVVMINRAIELSTDNEVMRKYLLRAVTNNIPYEQLDIPLGKNQYYELRKKFFYTLLQLKRERESCALSQLKKG